MRKPVKVSKKLHSTNGQFLKSGQNRNRFRHNKYALVSNLPDRKRSCLIVIVACIHGLFDQTGSSIDYFNFGSPGHIMVSFVVLLIPANISVWLGD